MKMNKKLICVLLIGVTSLSLVGCGGSKKPVETTETTQAPIEETPPPATTNIRETIKLDESNNKLLFLNSLLKNGSKILSEQKFENEKKYILSAPPVPANQKDIANRTGNCYIQIITDLTNGVESEKEIKLVVQNDNDKLIDSNLPEMVLIEKIYGKDFKDGSNIYENHKKDYLNSNYKFYATYNTNTLLNNVWSIDLNSKFFGYNTYGNDVEKTITITLSKTPNNLLSIFDKFYKQLVGSGYKVESQNDSDLIVFNHDSGSLKTSFKLYPTYVEIIQKGNSEKLYTSWEKPLTDLNYIDIYKVIEMRNVQDNIKNVLNYVKDVPYTFSSNTKLSIPYQLDENTYKSEFKALSTNNKNEDFVVEIYLNQDKLNDNLELRVKIVPLFLKK